ncbi:MAG: TfuA-related McrA-glycine thioamidation protein [Candidatus Methanosuratus sp.]|nr:TfuA-related McrA-glycine thioamidation protein [Candidatus Methanosuratincola sp.]
MKVVIFLGPSLPHEEAQRILSDAEYRPPAARGDIMRAAAGEAEVIALIDGVFYQQAAVSHREILHAIGKRIKVFGGSSMGALRASELDVYGMIGIGTVYEWYKAGKIRSDDEVALAFHPGDFRPLSEPLVNIRATLEQALASGGITQQEHDAVLTAAKDVPFQLRNYPRILQRAVHGGISGTRAGEILDLIKRMRVDLKREDATKVLERIKEIQNHSNVQ